MKKDSEEILLDDGEEQNSEEQGEVVATDPNPKLVLAYRMVRDIRHRLENLEQFLDNQVQGIDGEASAESAFDFGQETLSSAKSGREVEGVFDGEQMIGEDGRKYAVPANYASKSKLVEGDLLRLTITDAGRFLFKQKGPIERQRLVGTLVYDEQRQAWGVTADGLKYRVLPAAVSYFQGQPGDQAVILVPQSTPSHWAAIENIIHQDTYLEG